MLRLKVAVIILAVMALPGLLSGQASPPAKGAQRGDGSSPLLQITQPPPGAKLAQTFVSVQYQLTNPTIAPAGSPNFKVQLDNQDPITTTQTSQDFTGLAPGAHTVSVQLVDANGAPIAGAAASIRFTIVNPAPQQLSARVLPSGGSTLPLLSVVGLGVLLGGVVSAVSSTR